MVSSSKEQQTFLKPVRNITGSATPPSFAIEEAKKTANLLQLATKILEDPLLQRKLSDRVYELLLEDLRIQKERSRNYGSRLL
jgi:hypothetical protein